MNVLVPYRRLVLIAILLAAIISFVRHSEAQEDANDVPLGDVARSFRKTVPPHETVIDNDNLTKVMNEAETERAAGLPTWFSLEPWAGNLRAASPDVTCSLAFNGKDSSLHSDSALLNDLPRAELAKIEGPAKIDGDSLQITVHNGSAWDLREVIVGLTIVNVRDSGAASHYGTAKLLPAAGAPAAQDPLQKQPDVTLLLHVKGEAAPATTAAFRTSLNFELFPDQEWHWAIMKAKGIAPQIPVDALMKPAQPTPPSPAANQSSAGEIAPANVTAANPALPNSASAQAPAGAAANH